MNILQICIITMITRDYNGAYDGPFKFACHNKPKQMRGVGQKGKEGYVGLEICPTKIVPGGSLMVRHYHIKFD